MEISELNKPPHIKDPPQNSISGDQSHTQPVHIKDPPAHIMEEWEPGREMADNTPQTPSDVDWLQLAKDAFNSSTTWMDSNYRLNWDDSLRMFNNQHPSDSPYHKDIYRQRSKLFVPKTRTIVRKNEAATAAAFFSNMDRTSISPSNHDDKDQRIAADVIQELVQYRLTRSIPWFLFVQGGMQDAQVQGASIAHIHWVFRSDDKGEIIEDRPRLDLIPGENFRFDSAADWTDPVNTSPYIIHLYPMYVVDVKDRMEKPDPKGQTWKYYSDTVLGTCSDPSDSTRMARLAGRQDPTQTNKQISDYDTVWIHRHIHRRAGMDFEFFTLGSEYLLTEPQPLKKSVFHGQRPYVMGYVQIETHKALPVPLTILTKDLQQNSNEVRNSRMDNVFLAMNKRWFVLRGKNVDLSSLTRNIAGGATILDRMDDVKSEEFQDVTSSSFLETDRINQDFDELAGNFSAAAVQQQGNPRQPARSMQMLQSPANLLTEYMLKTYSETFIVPVLRQLVLLEQHYETDMNIITLSAKKSGAYKRYDLENKLEQMKIDQELNVTVNVGMGVTDPNMKLAKFLAAITQGIGVIKQLPPGVDASAIWKEIFGLSGYQDGAAFLMNNDPEALSQGSMQQKQMQMLMQQLVQKIKEKDSATQAKVAIAHEGNLTKLAIAGGKEKVENVRLLAQHMYETMNPATPPMGKAVYGNGQNQIEQ